MDAYQHIWSNMVIGIAVSVLGFAQLAILLVIGLREQLNRAFAFLTAIAFAVGLCVTISHAVLLPMSQNPLDDAVLQRASLWLGLAAAGIFLVGPALLSYASAFAEASHTESAKQDIRTSKTRIFKPVAVITVAVGLALLPAFLSNQAILRPYLSQNGYLDWELTRLGFVVFGGPFLLELLALHIFWRSRHRAGRPLLTAATAAWLLGSAAALFGESHVGGLTLGALVLVLGYGTVNIQVVGPLRSYRAQDNASVAARTRDLQREKDRFQRLYDQQRRIGQISTELAQLGDPNKVAERLVDLIHNSLGYHHVYLYLADDNSSSLVVRAAAGTTARTLMENGHRLRIGGSSVSGQASAERMSRVAEAKGDDARLFGDTALPGARCEMALPLVAGNRLLGVLDLQSIHFGAFSEQDLDQLNSLASGVAVSINTLRRLRDAEEMVAEAEGNQRRFLESAWRPSLENTQTELAYEYTSTDGVSPVNRENLSALNPICAADGAIPIALHSERLTKRNNLTDTDEIVLTIPVRGQAVGTLTLRHKPGRTWKPDDVETLRDVVERAGFALETARLYEDSQRTVAREQLIGRFSTRIRETLSVETLLRTAAREVREALQLSAVEVRLGNEHQVMKMHSQDSRANGDAPPGSLAQEHSE